MGLIQIELSGVLHPPITRHLAPSEWTLGWVLKHPPDQASVRFIREAGGRGHTIAVLCDQADVPEVYRAIRAWLHSHNLGTLPIHSTLMPDAVLISRRVLVPWPYDPADWMHYVELAGFEVWNDVYRPLDRIGPEPAASETDDSATAAGVRT